MILTLLLACTTAAPVTAAPPAEAAPTRVWIDVDVAAGVPQRDVDDAVALVAAFNSPELQVVGVSTVFGNTSLEQGDPIARQVVAMLDPTIPVFRGAAGPMAEGDASEASRAIAAALKYEPLTVLVLGPATNLATALQAEPALATRVEQAIVVAGRRPGQRFTTGTAVQRAHRDFNFEKDPHAFQVLLDLSVPLTLAPWEISSTVWLRQPDLDRLAAGPPHAAWLAAKSPSWLGLWEERFGVDGFNPFDTLALAPLTAPSLIQCTPATLSIVTHPDDAPDPSDTTAARDDKPFLEAVVDPQGAQTTRYCHTAATGFHDHLLSRLLAERPAP